MAAPVIHRQAALTRRRSFRGGVIGVPIVKHEDRSLHCANCRKGRRRCDAMPDPGLKTMLRADRWHREQGELTLALFFLFNLPADVPTAIG